MHQNNLLSSGSGNIVSEEVSLEKCISGSEAPEHEIVKTTITMLDSTHLEQSDPPHSLIYEGSLSVDRDMIPEDVTGTSSSEDPVLRLKEEPKTSHPLLSPHSLINEGSLSEDRDMIPEDVTGTSGSEDPVLRLKEEPKTSHPQLSESDRLNTPISRRHQSRLNSKSSSKKLVYTGSNRVLRSRSQEKSTLAESTNNLGSGNPDGERIRKRKNRKREKEIVADEYSRIRRLLKYTINRVEYEQSLIAAYSGDGWKGLSLEKLKPEKELQRAASEILQRKLTIRNLFKRIDSICAEGQLQASLFDSKGEIDSEDIFCAKCGSKDLSADNDIILCDGACDRGFHQLCLQPPLLKEHIPPDDEGWLCPGCDCKVDGIDLLNESQGTNLSVNDSWEKVFPEVEAAALAAHSQDDNAGLPSDDSGDDDYDPDNLETENKNQKNDLSSDESNFTSSSDESDFTSASDESDLASVSDEVKPPPSIDPYLGLPSDDSDDNDFDPDALDIDKDIDQKSSSSDFSSDPEDFDYPSTEGGTKKQSINNELSSVLDSSAGEGGFAVSSGKRNGERLDYKKLYDETYGKAASSNSSDDEDWTDSVAQRKRRRKSGDVSTEFENGNHFSMCSATDFKVTECTPERNASQESDSKCDDINVSQPKLDEGSAKLISSDKKVKSHARLGEAVTQRLYKSFNENRYPDRATKESLATELGLTYRQVDKWFTNARWSFNHSAKMDSHMADEAASRASEGRKK